MGIVTYNLTNWEQGSINTSGDTSSSSRIRTPDYIELTPNATVEYKVTVVDTNGNSLRWNPMLYNASKQCIKDGGWQNSGTTWTNTDQARYVRFCLSYSSGDITPSNLGSCVFEYDAHINWLMNDGEYPYLDSVPTTPLAFNEPYPIILMTQSDGKYPKFESLNLIDFSPDYPIILMTQRTNEYPKLESLDSKNLGAFGHCNTLKSITIPLSCTSIGKHTFTESGIKNVTLPNNCTYYSTSFPQDCNIIGGQLIE